MEVNKDVLLLNLGSFTSEIKLVNKTDFRIINSLNVPSKINHVSMIEKNKMFGLATDNGVQFIIVTK